MLNAIFNVGAEQAVDVNVDWEHKKLHQAKEEYSVFVTAEVHTRSDNSQLCARMNDC